MYGDNHGEIVDHTECPRCGSDHAVRRAKRKPGTLIAECRIVCPKCHLVKWNGIVTLEALSHREIIQRLKKRLKTERNESRRRRLERKIADLERKVKLGELGLR